MEIELHSEINKEKRDRVSNCMFILNLCIRTTVNDDLTRIGTYKTIKLPKTYTTKPDMYTEEQKLIMWTSKHDNTVSLSSKFYELHKDFVRVRHNVC